MYTLINKHVNTILAHDEIQDQVIGPYLHLRNTLYESDVSQDASFQRRYIGYWRMGRLSSDFYCHYFHLLEDLKIRRDHDVERVARELYETPTNAQGQRTVQFSFASKAVHMCEPTLPIYDATVRDFFFLPTRDSKKADRRLRALLTDYGFLIEEYGRIVQHHLLDEPMRAVRAYCTRPAELTDQRTIDLLIWAFVKWARRGGFRSGLARYS